MLNTENEANWRPVRVPAATDQRSRDDTCGIDELMRRLRAAGDAARAVFDRGHEYLYRGLADAARLAERLKRDDAAWQIFSCNEFFKSPPKRDDALRFAILFMLSASSFEDRQKASMYVRAVRFFVEVLGLSPDDLVEAIHNQRGGLTRAAALHTQAGRQGEKGGHGAGGPAAKACQMTDVHDGDLLPIPVKAGRLQRDTLVAATHETDRSSFALGVIMRDGEMWITGVTRSRVATVEVCSD
jgi:hypothetical protein